MIPAAFEYRRADSVEDAIDQLVACGEDAKLLAGGHSLVPLMKLRLATPAVVIDIGRLEGLDTLEERDGEVVIGALTRHCQMEHSEFLEDRVPLLAHVAHEVGDPQVRHRGTIGGTLAHGDPASDIPAAILALDGILVLEGPRGRREVRATEFFVGFLETALAPDELLVEVRVPATGSTPWAFEKFNRRAQDWAIVGVAALGTTVPQVALVNMDSMPVRATAVETALAAGVPVEEAAASAAEGREPPSDLNATADFRRHLARVLVRRTLQSLDA
jgi:aerobic carbon-monoxide dehydrogenase medium subunit